MGIDLLEIYMEVAEHFGIDDETLVQQEADTVRDLINNVINIVEAQHTEFPARLKIQGTVIAIISRVTGHPETKISPEDRLIDFCD